MDPPPPPPAGRFRLRVQVFPASASEDGDAPLKRQILIAKSVSLPLPDLTIRQLCDVILKRYQEIYPSESLFAIGKSQDSGGADLYLEDRVGDVFQDNEIFRIIQGNTIRESLPPDPRAFAAHNVPFVSHSIVSVFRSPAQSKKRRSSQSPSHSNTRRNDKRQRLLDLSPDESRLLSETDAPRAATSTVTVRESLVPNTQQSLIEQADTPHTTVETTPETSPSIKEENAFENVEPTAEPEQIVLDDSTPTSSVKSVRNDSVFSETNSSHRGRLKIVQKPKRRLVSQERSGSKSTPATTPNGQEVSSTAAVQRTLSSGGAPKSASRLRRPTIQTYKRTRGVSASNVYDEIEETDRDEPSVNTLQTRENTTTPRYGSSQHTFSQLHTSLSPELHRMTPSISAANRHRASDKKEKRDPKEQERAASLNRSSDAAIPTDRSPVAAIAAQPDASASKSTTETDNAVRNGTSARIGISVSGVPAQDVAKADSNSLPMNQKETPIPVPKSIFQRRSMSISRNLPASHATPGGRSSESAPSVSAARLSTTPSNGLHKKVSFSSQRQSSSPPPEVEASAILPPRRENSLVQNARNVTTNLSSADTSLVSPGSAERATLRTYGKTPKSTRRSNPIFPPASQQSSHNHSEALNKEGHDPTLDASSAVGAMEKSTASAELSIDNEHGSPPRNTRTRSDSAKAAFVEGEETPAKKQSEDELLGPNHRRSVDNAASSREPHAILDESDSDLSVADVLTEEAPRPVAESDSDELSQAANGILNAHDAKDVDSDADQEMSGVDPTMPEQLTDDREDSKPIHQQEASFSVMKDQPLSTDEPENDSSDAGNSRSSLEVPATEPQEGEVVEAAEVHAGEDDSANEASESDLELPGVEHTKVQDKSVTDEDSSSSDSDSDSSDSEASDVPVVAPANQGKRSTVTTNPAKEETRRNGSQPATLKATTIGSVRGQSPEPSTPELLAAQLSSSAVQTNHKSSVSKSSTPRAQSIERPSQSEARSLVNKPSLARMCRELRAGTSTTKQPAKTPKKSIAKRFSIAALGTDNDSSESETDLSDSDSDISVPAKVTAEAVPNKIVPASRRQTNGYSGSTRELSNDKINGDKQGLPRQSSIVPGSQVASSAVQPADSSPLLTKSGAGGLQKRRNSKLQIVDQMMKHQARN